MEGEVAHEHPTIIIKLRTYEHRS